MITSTMEFANWTTSIVLIFFLITCKLDLSSALYVSSLMHASAQPDELHFVRRFFFQRSGGLLEYQLRWPTVNATMTENYGIALLNRNEHLKTSSSSLTCRQLLSGTRTFRLDNCQLNVEDSKQYKTCSGRQVIHDREYFLYLTNCGHGVGVRSFTALSYTISMTNGHHPLRREFPADEMYLLETDLVALMLYVIMFVMATVFLVTVARKKLTTLWRFCFCSVVLETCGVLASTIGLGVFAREGKRLTQLETLGQVLTCAGMAVFSSLLVVVAKGHSVTRRRLSPSDNATIAAFTLTYGVANVTLSVVPEIHKNEHQFSETHKMTAIIQITAAAWFFYCVYCTLKDRRDRTGFYIPFLLVYLVWFLSEPSTLIILYSLKNASSGCPNIRNGVYWLTSILGHAYFRFLARSSGLSKRFPYFLSASKVHLVNEVLGEKSEVSSSLSAPSIQTSHDSPSSTPSMPRISRSDSEMELRRFSSSEHKS